ncbi:Acetamidase/Formamidase [Corchorus olitorius]|uniref:Acetamidase/Formamidase n=1 Tax=Corchorus olitorius TaxID=93759 RepID=A0A1R3K442_9ROSI|nr:Acetamidase/Formamidase [Corchorus olitorius]
MAQYGARVVVPIDLKKKPWEQKHPLHNRWHPDIPPVAEVKEAELFRIEMVDFSGGGITSDFSADDVKHADQSIFLSQTLLLSKLSSLQHQHTPFSLSMAPPTPRLVVPIDLKKKPWEQTLPLHNRWHPEIPPVADVEVGEMFRIEMVDWTGGVVKDDDSATDVKFIDLSTVHYLSGPIRVLDKEGIPAKPGTAEWEKIAVEAARTIPGRENGGNCDIKNLSRGSKIYLPVFIEGANLSTGDMHFSQGDGEVSFCGAIEMSGFLELKCEIIRGGMKEYLTPMGPTPLHVNPIFEIGPVEPRFSEWLVFEGISVDESGRQHFLDASVAYKRAVLNAIDYLSKFGYSKEQVYLLLSCCPCEGRISGIVDSPNAVATLAIPTAIFDQDIRPKTGKVPVGPRLVRKPDVLRCTYDGNLPTTKNPAASM